MEPSTSTSRLRAEYAGQAPTAVVGKEKLACINCVTDALTKRIRDSLRDGLPRFDHGTDVPCREATKEGKRSFYQKVMAGETAP